MVERDQATDKRACAIAAAITGLLGRMNCMRPNAASDQAEQQWLAALAADDQSIAETGSPGAQPCHMCHMRRARRQGQRQRETDGARQRRHRGGDVGQSGESEQGRTGKASGNLRGGGESLIGKEGTC